MHKKDLHVGDEVLMPWGVGEVRGTVQEIYGRHPRVHVVVLLIPEDSGYVVYLPTTFSWPISYIRKAA